MWNAKFLLPESLLGCDSRGGSRRQNGVGVAGSAQIFPHSSIDWKLGKSGIFLASSDLDRANGVPVAARGDGLHAGRLSGDALPS
jgi:hypothetical protein